MELPHVVCSTPDLCRTRMIMELIQMAACLSDIEQMDHDVSMVRPFAVSPVCNKNRIAGHMRT